MERLSNYAASSTEVLPEFLQVEAFSKLNNAIGKVNLCISLRNLEIKIIEIKEYGESACSISYYTYFGNFHFSFKLSLLNFFPLSMQNIVHILILVAGNGIVIPM